MGEKLTGLPQEELKTQDGSSIGNEASQIRAANGKDPGSPVIVVPQGFDIKRENSAAAYAAHLGKTMAEAAADTNLALGVPPPSPSPSPSPDMGFRQTGGNYVLEGMREAARAM